MTMLYRHLVLLFVCNLCDRVSYIIHTSVFFNLFFETEPFAAILIAHGTHGLSQKFV